MNWSVNGQTADIHREDLRLDSFYLKAYSDGSWYVFDEEKSYNSCVAFSVIKCSSIEEAKRRAELAYRLMAELRALERGL